MSAWRVTIRTDGGDLRGVITAVDDDQLMTALNEFAGVLDGAALVSPATPAEVSLARSGQPDREGQYEICKVRGHQASDYSLPDPVPKNICKWCGTPYWYTKELHELRDMPPLSIAQRDERKPDGA